MSSVRQLNDLFLLFRNQKIFERYGLKRIGVFGSFARGEQFQDIDLFIEDEIDYKKIIELKALLERSAGVRVDIMEKKSAEPLVLYRALKDMKYAVPS